MYYITVVIVLCCTLSWSRYGFGLAAPVANIPPSEMQALYDLYNITGGYQWSWRPVSQALGVPWNFSSLTNNPCHQNWQGITCNYQAPYNHISGITLISYNLTGPVPDSISQMPNLFILEISFNLLTGTIPVSISTLTKLQVLDMSGNTLTGTIPSTFRNLVQMRQLSLESNRLTGTIPEMFSFMGQLNFLTVALNKLNGTLPSSISGLASLSIVYFFGNQLTGRIPAVYGNMSGLLDLYIEENMLSGRIPETMGNLTQMRNLDMSNNALTGSIPASVGQMSSLINFYLHTNKLTGAIPNTIGGMKKLQFLDASDNKLTGTVPSIMGNLSHLQYIQLYINQLTGTIPEELYALSGLQRLDLNTDNLVGPVPQHLYFWPQMLLLDLSFNTLTGTLPAALVNLTQVQYLALDDNSLSGTVPAALSTLAELSVLHLQDNRLSGPLTHVFNASLQIVLTAVEVSNNDFTGPLPEQLFQLNSLSSLVAVGNCFYGQIPAAVCNASELVSLVLDGLSSAHSCRSTVLDGISSSYVIKRSVTGRIPHCLFQLPVLTTLHLSGNGFTGTLPELQLSASLVDMILSHNRLTGSIPTHVQERRWYNLDLSYNRLSGTLISDVEARTINATSSVVQQYIKPVYGFLYANATITPSLSLENNRISGRVPASLLNFANISILGSNLFTCDFQGSDLPLHDQGRNNYECGSTRFDVTYYIWLALVIVVGLWGAVLWFTRRGKHTILATAISYLEVWEQYSSMGGNFKARLTTFGHLLDIICRMAVLCAAFIAFALLPVYAACSHYYGTYTHSYAWAVSAAYLAGAVPLGVEIPLLLALLCVVLVVFTRRIAQLGSRNVQQHRVGSTRDMHVQHIVATTLLQKTIIYSVYTVVNLVVVIGVNVTYVYIAIYQGAALLVFAQIVLSFFKLIWNNVCTVKLMRFIVQLTIADQSTEVDNYAETQFVSLQIFVALLNSIAIPCMVVSVISPSCFYNVFVAPPTVNSYYTYQYCSVFSEAGDCTVYKTKVGTTSYSPPFTYSYQCSSSLITYYAPAFVNLCIISTIATPVAQYATQILLSRATPGTTWFSLLNKLTPHMLKLLTSKPRAGATFLRANQMLTILITYLGMLLTFGAMFPPLAVALAVTISVFVLVAKLKIGKFLLDAADKGFVELVDKIDLECHGVGAVSVLKNAMWMLITISCFFYTLFLFDTLGNEQGFKNSFWLLFVIPAVPGLMYMTHKFALKRCITMPTDTEHIDAAATAEEVSLELPDVPASRSRHNTAVDIQKSIAASGVSEATAKEHEGSDEGYDDSPPNSVTYNAMLSAV